MTKEKNKLKVVSLFSGIGGLDLDLLIMGLISYGK